MELILLEIIITRNIIIVTILLGKLIFPTKVKIISR